MSSTSNQGPRNTRHQKAQPQPTPKTIWDYVDKTTLYQATGAVVGVFLLFIYVSKYMNVYHVAILEAPFVVYFFYKLLLKLKGLSDE